jgi:signal transduction histidine kinase
MTSKNLHRMTKAQLVEELEKLQYRFTLLDATEKFAHIGHCVWDYENGCIITCSNEYARIFNMSIEEVIKSQDSWEKSLLQIHPDDREHYRISYKEMGINWVHDIEYRIIRNDDEIRNIREIGVVGTTRGGVIRGTLGLLQDLTEQKRAEREFRGIQEDLRRNERLATIGQLTATVSHELRNPLAAMRPPLYTLKKNLSSESQFVIDALNRLDRNVDRCDHIIDEMLDFTRIQGQERRSMVFDEWLSEVLDDQPPRGNIRVKRELGLGDRVLSINAEGFRRALINLYDNACQVMLGDNGTGDAPNGSIIEITTRATDERIELEVSDTGPGIPNHVLPNIFEPLFSTKSFGVGLGLPTVKRVLEEHGGGVEVQTEESSGTRMLLWLPLSG